jgi:NAD(P)-dependent dehydrogenase (short-subunit alcohol dehydrogenase family)
MTERSAGRLAGRKVLITGAGSGLGLATAELFAAQGARLALLDRDGAAVRRAAEATGGYPIEADVTDEWAVQKSVAEVAEVMDGLDGVVNSAGIMCGDTLIDTSLAAWQRVLDVNMTGPFLICRAAVPFLRQRFGATIVNIASAQAILPGLSGGAYAASKAGVMVFTKSLAAELAPDIRANAICPGAATTPMSEAAMAALDEAGRAAFVKRYAIGRFSRPDEIANAILFLTADESSSVTGIALAVDGGRTFH